MLEIRTQVRLKKQKDVYILDTTHKRPHSPGWGEMEKIYRKYKKIFYKK